MTHISLDLNDRSTIGAAAAPEHFGVNMLFDRDRAHDAASPIPVSETYDTAVATLGARTFRYPGGTIAETLFDIANPESGLQNWLDAPGAGVFVPDGAGRVEPGTLPLSQAVDYAAARGMSMSVVLPTYRYLSDRRDADGHRHEAVNAAEVKAFILHLLETSAAEGVRIEAIELGNEWWVDNSALFGARMTAVEYGRIASRLAMVVQNAIEEAQDTGLVPSGFAEPNILVQVGPAGAAEWLTADGRHPPAGYDGPLVTATELIFRQFDMAGEQTAVDGILTHRYLTGAAEGINGWAYGAFNTWDRLAAENPNFGDMTRYVTEWNIAARNATELGLKQSGTLVALFEEMLRADVHHANIWAVQQNNGTRLSQTVGYADDQFAGLSIAGETFRMMNQSLWGLRSLDIGAPSGDVAMHAFGDADRIVLFLSNRTARDAAVTLDLGAAAPGHHHAWAATLGVGDGAHDDVKATPVIAIRSGGDLVAGGGPVTFELAPYELVRLTIALGSAGVTMDGHSLADRLEGSRHGDTIWGAGGDDVAFGGAGGDILYGGTRGDAGGLPDDGMGNDTLVGGAGDDSAYGGSGDDRLAGCAGDDVLDGGIGHDTLTGGAGHDRIAGGEGADRIAGDAGRDTLDGGAGNDTLAGGSGDDVLIAGPGADRLAGGAGADTFVFGRAALDGTGDAADVILGFRPGQGDVIDLSGLGLDYIGAAGFAGAGEAALRYADGRLAADLDGDGLADAEIVLAGAPRIDADAFVF